MLFKVKVYGRTKSDHKSSPCHFVTGELKRILPKCLYEIITCMIHVVQIAFKANGIYMKSSFESKNPIKIAE
jgi:hypothetical protein